MEDKEPGSTYSDVDKLNDLIKGVKIAMFTTTTADHSLHSVPLMTQEIDFDGDLWFLISKNSQKVQEIQNEKHVSLSYATSTKFVSVTGTAELVNNHDKVQQLWHQSYLAWFPQGVHDPTIQLLKVNVERAEYWEGHSAAVSKVLAFVKIATKSHIKMANHGEINLKH